MNKSKQETNGSSSTTSSGVKSRKSKTHSPHSYKQFDRVQHNFFNSNKNFIALISFLFPSLELKEEDILDLDSKEGALFIEDNKGKKVKVSEELFREIKKLLNVLYDGKCIYMGIENQVKIDRSFLGRINHYNAITYSSPNIFDKDGHRIPVITIIINWGKNRLKTPTYCFDDYNYDFIRRLGLEKYLPCYEVPAFNIVDVTEEEMEGMVDDLKVMTMVVQMALNKVKGEQENKYADKITNIFKKGEIGIETKDLTAVYLEMNQEEINKDMENNGFAEYFRRRDEQMKADGLAEGMQKGKSEGIVSSVKKLMKNMDLTFDNAANILEIPQSERETIKALV